MRDPMGVVNVALLDVLKASELLGISARDLELLLLGIEEIHNVQLSIAC